MPSVLFSKHRLFASSQPKPAQRQLVNSTSTTNTTLKASGTKHFPLAHRFCIFIYRIICPGNTFPITKQRSRKTSDCDRSAVSHVSRPSHGKNSWKECQNLKKKNQIYGTVSAPLPLQITINFKMFTHSPPTTLPQPMVNASHSWILMCTLFLWRTEAVLETKHSLRGW